MSQFYITPNSKRILWTLIGIIMIFTANRHLAYVQSLEQRIATLETQADSIYISIKKASEASLHTPKTYQTPTHTNTLAPKRQANKTIQSAHHAENKKTQNTNPGESQVTNDVSTNYNTNKPQTNQTTDSYISYRSNKFQYPVTIELNSTDSATLVRIPGIAEKTARVILKYRSLLGGFYSPWQLQERLTWDAAQTYMKEWCTQWFVADSTLITPLRINQLSFKELLRHPYLNYQQVQAIEKYKKRHKRITSVEVFRQLEQFSEEDITRLQPYLSFD